MSGHHQQSWFRAPHLPGQGSTDLVHILNKLVTRDKRPPKDKWTASAINLVVAQGTMAPLLRELTALNHIGDNPLMIWKGLGLIHRVCQEAGQSVLADSSKSAIDTVNYLRRLCDRETNLYSKAAGLLAQAVTTKVEAHKEFQDFNGLWVSDRTVQDLHETCGQRLTEALLEVQQLLIMTTTVVLSMSGATASSHRQTESDYRKHGCLAWPLVAIIRETVSVYCLLLQIIDERVRKGEDVWGDARRFCDQHAKLRGIYQSARALPFLAARVITLRLDAEPPAFDISYPLAIPETHEPTDADVALAAHLGDDLFLRGDASPAMPRRSKEGGRRGGGSGDRGGGGGARGRGSSLASSFSAARSSREPEPVDAKKRLHELEQEREDMRGTIASYESYIKDLTGGLTHVDPDSIAELVAAAHSGANAATRQKSEFEVLNLQHHQLQEEYQQLEASSSARLAETARKEQTLEAQVRDLQVKVEELSASLASVQNVKEDLEQASTQAQNDVAAAAAEIEQRQRELDALQQTLADKEEQLFAATTAHSALEEKMCRAQAAFEEREASLVNEASALRFEIENQKEKADIMQTQVDSLQAENAILLKRDAGAKEAHEASTAVRAELEAQLARTQAMLDEANRKSVTYLERMIAEQERCTATRQEKVELHARCDEAEANAAALTSRVEAQSQELMALQAAQVEARTVAEARIQALQSDLAHSEERALQAMQADEHTSQEAEALQQQVVELRAALASAEEKHATESTRLATETARATAAEQEAQAAVAKAAQVAEALAEARRNRTADREAHEAALQQEQSRVQEAETAHADATEKLAQAEQAQVSATAELKRAVAAAESESAAGTQRAEQAEAAAAAARKEVERVRQESTRRLEELRVQGERQLQQVQSELQRQAAAHAASEKTLRTQAQKTLVRGLERVLQLPAAGLPAADLVAQCRAELAALQATAPGARSTDRAVTAAGALSHATSTLRQLAESAAAADGPNAASTQDAVAACSAAEASTATALAAVLQADADDSSSEASQGQATAEATAAADAALQRLADTAEMLEARIKVQGGALEQQMHEAASSVDAARQRIEALLVTAQQGLDEKKLAVHKGILDHSMSLMTLIQQLIAAAGLLQQEIVAAETSAGKGPTNVANFYKRNSRWVEGLLSAAKAVGGAATATVDAADRALAGKGKLEELMVCGQEISASTAQLVSASRVKARPNSDRKAALERNAADVYGATQQLIEVVRQACLQSRTPQKAEDYLKLTLVQAKRLQMDSQIRALELENELHNEQVRLRQLRKAHYQLSERADVLEDGSLADDADGDDSAAPSQ